MSTDERYNGWASRETWAVSLYLNNDQAWQEDCLRAVEEGPYGSEGFTLAEAREAFCNAPTFIQSEAGERIRDYVNNLAESVLEGFADRYTRAAVGDMGSLWRVDWREVGASFLEDVS